MTNLILKDENNFEKNISYFFSEFNNSIPKEFSKTQVQFIRTNKGKAVNPSYSKYYIDDFIEVLASRLTNLSNNQHFEILENIITSIDLLYRNISDIYINCYNGNLISFSDSVTNYFNYIETINRLNLSLCIHKYSSNKIDFNEVNIFIQESFEYLKIKLNNTLFIEIDKTPLAGSFDKLLASFEKNINSNLNRRSKKKKKRLEMNDFLTGVENKEVFMNDLIQEFKSEEGAAFFMLINELTSNHLLTISNRKKKDLFLALNKTFGRKIGVDSGFYDKVFYNLNKESDQNLYKKDIKLNSARHSSIVMKLKHVLEKHDIRYSPIVTS